MFLKTQSCPLYVGMAVLLKNKDIINKLLSKQKMMMHNSIKDWVMQNGSKRPNNTHQD